MPVGSGPGFHPEDGLKEYGGRIFRYGRHLIQPVDSGHDRRGMMFRAEEVQQFHLLYNWGSKTEDAFMNVIEELKGRYDEAETLWKAYETKLASFRSAVKNDVLSLEASARKANEAVARIRNAHEATFAMMNGKEMEDAIANAERLAGALERIAGLKSHKLTLAVIDSALGPEGKQP